MSTSDTKRHIPKYLISYLAITLFCVLFSAVYEHFSHGVTSYYMVCLFAVPLVGGAAFALWSHLAPEDKKPGTAVRRIYNYGVGTLAVGCALQGALEIYGTTSAFTPVYPAAGIALLATSVVVWLVRQRSQNGRHAA